ncbi:hypothetical protein EVAR_71052_1 [Eumeta japonica]|uniref:Uncharacterized protein n=1 Tax=Eumeta variegata TaxID=151549 RepID=A0A4C1TH24_EUMVA|nr:hypothetical protein EVAR_71052_1 [Eumeta japonica]
MPLKSLIGNGAETQTSSLTNTRGGGGAAAIKAPAICGRARHLFADTCAAHAPYIIATDNARPTIARFALYISRNMILLQFADKFKTIKDIAVENIKKIPGRVRGDLARRGGNARQANSPARRSECGGAASGPDSHGRVRRAPRSTNRRRVATLPSAFAYSRAYNTRGPARGEARHRRDNFFRSAGRPEPSSAARAARERAATSNWIVHTPRSCIAKEPRRSRGAAPRAPGPVLARLRYCRSRRPDNLTRFSL